MTKPGVKLTFEITEESLRRILHTGHLADDNAAVSALLKPDFAAWKDFIECDVRGFLDHCEIERCDVEVATPADMERSVA